MTNTFELESYGVLQLSENECYETEGGVHPAWMVAAAVGGGVLGVCVGLGVAYLCYKYL